MGTIRVEFSGYGHYGICTILDRQDLISIIDEIRGLEQYQDSWANLDYPDYLNRPTGFDSALWPIPADHHSLEANVRLGWRPGKLGAAIRSHQLIWHMASSRGMQASQPELGESNLYLIAGPTANGWFVQASFGNPIWDVIERSDFIGLLPQINADIRSWCEDQSGTREDGQYTTVFTGRDGPTLQVYQPDGDGLWIVGSRQHSNSSGYQLTDHNTDCATHATAHIVSLCTILKYCRRRLLDLSRPY